MGYCSGMVPRVSIGEEQELPGSMVRKLMTGPTLPDPPWRWRRPMQNGETRMPPKALAQYAGSLIIGLVIENDHFKI